MILMSFVLAFRVGLAELAVLVLLPMLFSA